MFSRVSPHLILRALATSVAVGGIGIWLATGAHRGWTRTSEVEMRRDEITGIDDIGVELHFVSFLMNPFYQETRPVAQVQGSV